MRPAHMPCAATGRASCSSCRVRALGKVHPPPIYLWACPPPPPPACTSVQPPGPGATLRALPPRPPSLQFLRGITTMVREEFEADDEPDPLLEEFNASRCNSASGMRAAAAMAAAAAAGAGAGGPRPSQNGGGATRVMQMQAAEAGHGQPLARVSASGGSTTGLKSCLRASSSGTPPAH
jgi:hypothetical protein